MADEQNQSSERVPLNMRATYYIPVELDMRMERMLLELRINHGIRVNKSELTRAGLELILSLNPAKITEMFV